MRAEPLWLYILQRKACSSMMRAVFVVTGTLLNVYTQSKPAAADVCSDGK